MRFVSWSHATGISSVNMMSTHGRYPSAANPAASPRKPASEIGVSRTRPGPNWRIRRRVIPNGPPQASTKPSSARPGAPATSSPRTMTDGSRAISWRSASLHAFQYFVRLMRSPPIDRWIGEHAVEQVGERGLAAGPRALKCGHARVPRLGSDRSESILVDAGIDRDPAQQRDGVAVEPRLKLGLRAVAAVLLAVEVG